MFTKTQLDVVLAAHGYPVTALAIAGGITAGILLGIAGAVYITVSTSHDHGVAW